VVVFNQKSNPLTSVESIFGGFKNLSFKKIFSINTLTILAFLCILLIFYIPKGICGDIKSKRLDGIDEIDSNPDVILDTIDNEKLTGIRGFICGH
jgi:hypothetical protein